MSDNDARSLRQRQVLFARLLPRLIDKAFELGLEVTMADGSIDTPRHYVSPDSGKIETGRDAVHLEGGCHYKRLAQDINLFRGGDWITDGGDPVWAKLAIYWEGLDSLCTSGWRFGDSNHFSVTHGGMK